MQDMEDSRDYYRSQFFFNEESLELWKVALSQFEDDARVALALDDDVNVRKLFHDAANFNRRIDEQSNQELAWSIVNGVPVDFGEEDGDE